MGHQESLWEEPWSLVDTVSPQCNVTRLLSESGMWSRQERGWPRCGHGHGHFQRATIILIILLVWTVLFVATSRPSWVWISCPRYAQFVCGCAKQSQCHARDDSLGHHQSQSNVRGHQQNYTLKVTAHMYQRIILCQAEALGVSWYLVLEMELLKEDSCWLADLQKHDQCWEAVANWLFLRSVFCYWLAFRLL